MGGLAAMPSTPERPTPATPGSSSVRWPSRRPSSSPTMALYLVVAPVPFMRWRAGEHRPGPGARSDRSAGDRRSGRPECLRLRRAGPVPRRPPDERKVHVIGVLVIAVSIISGVGGGSILEIPRTVSDALRSLVDPVLGLARTPSGSDRDRRPRPRSSSGRLGRVSQERCPHRLQARENVLGPSNVSRLTALAPQARLALSLRAIHRVGLPALELRGSNRLLPGAITN
jgi:hypothetical protein